MRQKITAKERDTGTAALRQPVMLTPNKLVPAPSSGSHL